jgi:ribonuclease HI
LYLSLYRYFYSSCVVDCHASTAWQMLEESSVYVEFTDGASHHTWNHASATWVIYSPTNQLISTRGVCLRATTNNLAEYNVMIELLRSGLSYGIQRPQVYLDFELVVSQLNGLYHIFNPILLRRFLRVRHLERSFVFITYIHVPRKSNLVIDAYANYILYWHLSHQ